MEGDKERARQAIKRALMKKANKEVTPKVQEKAKRSLKSLGVSESDMRKAAIAAKLGYDISRGEAEYDINPNVSVRAKVTPEERALGLKFKKKF
jgi:hypothetical protein